MLVQHCGVRHGDRVAIAMRNYPEWVLAFTAITSIGAVAVAMNAYLQVDEMVYGSNDCGAKAIVAEQERQIKASFDNATSNIGCGQVEAALLLHPQVHEAAVFAVPDERLGEEVGGMIYDDAELDLDAQRQFPAGHLARFELPRYIVRSTQPLARTPSGKIHKREIRAAALARIELGSTAELGGIGGDPTAGAAGAPQSYSPHDEVHAHSTIPLP